MKYAMTEQYYFNKKACLAATDVRDLQHLSRTDSLSAAARNLL